MKQTVEQNKKKIELLVKENEDLEKDISDLNNLLKTQTENALE
jgi:hypothetical protein